MNHKNRLFVVWDEQIAGILEQHAKGGVVFQYTQDWLKNSNRPISLSLPCTEKKYSPAISTAFFENLLPENNARTILAFNHRFSEKDTFAFLEKFGEDCAGALSIISEENNPDFTPGQYQNIDAQILSALDKIMASPGNYQLFPEIKKARLSIAGAQDKLPVYFKKDHFFLPLTSGSATTHIIKPVNLNFPDFPRNEAFCMELARKTGLDVPDSELIKMGKHELFIVSRYDRQESDHKVIRIHQEDFCQALGFPVSRKYQEGGGPGFAQCRELIDEYLSDQGADARINLARIMVLNYLIGNHDAHGKNFSIIHGKELRIAPFYDLVSTQVYPALDNKFAMAIGQTYKADRIKEHSFKLFATDMNIRPQKLTELMNEICQLVDKRYPVLLADHEKRYGPSKIYTDLFNVLQTNLKNLNCLFD